MLLEYCFAVKLTLHYLFRLAGTSGFKLVRDALGSLGTLTLVHSHHLYHLLIIVFRLTLIADINEFLTLRNVHLDREHQLRERKKIEVVVDQDD